MRAREFLPEINSPGELSVDPDLIKRFTDAGWQIDGEGRDQIVLSKPDSKTVLKVVGQGTDAHPGEIRQYVNFFRANQRNPYFPRVGADKILDWKGRRYYAYSQERLLPLPGDEAVMDYLEYAMGELGHGEDPDYSRVPPGLTVEQIDGLVMAIDDMFDSGLLKQHNFDLGNVANIMQRANGQLVIVDPTTSLDNLDEDGSPDSGPIRAYHGTFQPTIERFQPLSHFGTRAAAEERLRFKGKREGINRPGRIYQVALDIKRPFRVRDFAGIHSPTHFAFDLRQAGLIDQEEMLAITRLAGEAGQSQALIRKLQDLGFDGMVYRNKYEDPGSESYVITDPNQVVSVKPITENFADKKVKGKSRPGRVKRAGASCKGSVTDLRARAKKYGGEKGKMYHWCANMKSGRRKSK
jgi:hypothetical protein